MSKFHQHYSTRQKATAHVPQSQPIPGREQEMVKNSDGMFVFAVDKWVQLNRFLVIGTTGGSFYASEKKLTVENAKVVEECLREDGLRVVRTIVDVSDAGRAPSNDPALYALAMASAAEDEATRKAALEALPKVARIGTHVQHFAEYVKGFRGWGRALRNAVGAWFTAKSPESLVTQMLKYQQRDGWSMRDLLRLAHPTVPAGTEHEFLVRLATTGWDTKLVRVKQPDGSFREEIRLGASTLVSRVQQGWRSEAWLRDRAAQIEQRLADGGLPAQERELVEAELGRVRVAAAEAGIGSGWARLEQVEPRSSVVQRVEAVRRLRGTEGRPLAAREAAKLIVDFKLEREMLPTELLTEPLIWEALLQHMKPEAMIRNLGVMTARGVLAPMSAGLARVREVLGSSKALKEARLHPMKVLLALNQYQQGHGDKGSLVWRPVQQVMDALDGAFYLSFGAVEPTGKRTQVWVDVSQSMMGAYLANTTVRVSVAAAAMALVTAATEQNHEIMGFSNRVMDPKISPRMRLDAVIKATQGIIPAGTDCSLPIRWAMEQKRQVDTFVIYTDNEQNFEHSVQPAVALRQYRERTGIPARLVVAGMAASRFSIADQRDALMLDVVGFDAATPAIISGFSAGLL